MSMDMSHERCSELLHAYHGGDLAAADQAAVRAHVAGCGACRAELAAVAELAAAAHGELQPDERRRLHEAVAQALAAPPRRAADVLPLEARADRAPRAARWLGAAAAVLVIAVGAGLASRAFIGGGEPRGAAEDAAGAAGGAGAERQAAPEFDGPAPVFADSHGRFALGDAGTDTEAAAEARSSKTFVVERRLDGPSGLRRLARAPLYAEFAAAYGPDDARELAEHFLSLLGASAPEGARAQLEECGQIALDASPSPILPVFAATLSYKGDASLVLGFVTGDAALANYSIWVWPEGSCDRPVDSVYAPLP